jgi:predicted RNase H-like nuclease (RuvC/YqgF family)
MTNGSIDINEFAVRIRSLIRYTEKLKASNAELSNAISVKDDEIEQLKAKLSEQEEKYNALLTARMLDITDGNIETVRKQVNNLIRNVNQCITLLSDK